MVRSFIFIVPDLLFMPILCFGDLSGEIQKTERRTTLTWTLNLYSSVCSLFTIFDLFLCQAFNKCFVQSHVSLKQALKLMLWFSVEKGEIHVGLSGTSCDFEILESYCDFFFFSSCFFCSNYQRWDMVYESLFV